MSGTVAVRDDGALSRECHCASCNRRYAASRQPKRYPAWVTTPGWGAWDGRSYAENRPNRPPQTAQEPRKGATAYQTTWVAI